MTCDTQALIEGAKCYIAVASNRQLIEAAEILALCAILDGDTSLACDPAALITAAACLAQQIPPGYMGAIRLSLLCQISNNPSSGGSCLYCGDVDPVDAPTCDCALAYNRLTGSLWFWDSNLVQWVALIAA